MDRVLTLLLVLAVAAALTAWWRSRDGRVTTTPPDTDGRPGIGSAAAADIVAAIRPITALTLVEFTAPACAPCTRARAVLDQAAAGRDDVSVVAIDVGKALELARSHRIMRAPTTLLIDRSGHLLGRIAGVPRPDELAGLLDGARGPAPTAGSRR